MMIGLATPLFERSSLNMRRMASVSILSPEGYQSSSCGYCGSPGKRSSAASFHSVGASAQDLITCDVSTMYQKMIDRGWRRSGDYCYKPDMRRTCCPQYTIRLDALEFAPSKKQRKVVHRYSRKVGIVMSSKALVTRMTSTWLMMLQGIDLSGKKSKKPPPFSLIDSIHASEASFRKDETPPKHKFEDVAASSVYFMYDNKWEKFSLGKLSALREAAFAREMYDHGAQNLMHLYMGYYVHSCQKMRYKAEYSPSFLLDPEEYTWYPLKACLPLLDANRYACFSHPEHSLKDPDILPKPTPGDISAEDAVQIMIYHINVDILPLAVSVSSLNLETKTRKRLADLTWMSSDIRRTYHIARTNISVIPFSSQSKA
ncbi:hypothetical protein EW145_g155 [Phellinidium pouzarii]|uniref:arginyltransferase n=1 Tax=Phellinidium pouzarii TaxID=167371 RepID=A0A4S4LK79_9AGAM|nr:hypothetical protein EW145_g155 [Phellinidium pouzarii]